jgi:4-amino-4-deoxy-L-arabinose transferase-like glycosyltransferase
MDGYLFGEKAKFRLLFFASLSLFFTLLGSRELWTQEFRWEMIVSTMLDREDLLHPYLGTKAYYDKPLLSYWLMVFFAKIHGTLTAWELRLPSALSGLLTVGLVYRLGHKLKNKSFGLLSGWMLLTTYYFVFWARTSSADMLNVAGSLLAITWYIEKRESRKGLDYIIFFLIIALTSLCKGLIGAIVPFIAVSTDITLQGTWKNYLKRNLFFYMLPALIIYFLPFLVSAYFNNADNQHTGLYFVYRENILRFFHPFDHQGPIFTYFIYLPIYLLPWSFFFAIALFSLHSRLKTMPLCSKWLMWTTFLLFLFFSLSGSRRSYYVLPIVPFAVLMTADWLMFSSSFCQILKNWLSGVVILSFAFLFMFIVLIPTWYYAEFGSARFAAQLKNEAEKKAPWASWRIVMLNAEDKLNFYLHLPPTTLGLSVSQVGSYLEKKPAHTIFISRQCYLTQLLPFFSTFTQLSSPPPFIHFPLLRQEKENMPIAFISNE